MQTDEAAEGLRIALARIAQEAEERSGFLDLGMLGLTELPEALFGLRHLRGLNLGSSWRDEAGRWRLVAYDSDIADNDPGLTWVRLAELPELRVLSLLGISVDDLSPLSGLAALQTLDCGGTPVADLSPLSGLAALQTLDCGGTPVADLSPLSGLDNLQVLNFSECKLEQIPAGFCDKPSLQEIYLYGNPLPGIPAEVVSQDDSDNCLDRLRAHLRDLEAGSEALPDVKLMVLGNGRVGKTQICRRLRGEDYDDTVPSTHGILISAASLRDGDGAEWARLQAWDFGGQEIYHGTHALFLKTRAVFLIVWATETENQESHEHGGMVFRNHPLGYWLAYVRHLAGPDSAVIVVQTRCDRPEDEARRLPVEDAEIEDFPFFKVVQFSSLKNRGRAALDEALREAVDWLWQGRALIGAGRLRVRRRLEALREADAQVPAHERQYRTLSQEHFRQLCEEAGGVSSPEHLLDYLHQSGVVFYRAGLFGERIVLDQGWALEAIYTLFHREKCYRELKRLGGRFTRSLLDMLVWQAHSADEQALFLDMMESCGLCFTHKPGNEDVEAEYIAPDLLPARADVEVDLERWGIGAAEASAVYRYALHQPGLLRSLMAEIGQQAGVNGLYWRDGVCVYERETRSHAVIEQESLGDWRGLIRISTHGGRAAELLGRLRKRLEAQNRQWGLEAVEEPAAVVAEKSGLEARAPSLAFVQPPQPGLEYCVSYARGDASPEGVARGEVVERLCELAQAKGIHILRDQQDLALGDNLSKFMRRIGQGDRVFVIISDKYLKSPYCMYELFEIWRVSRQESAEFLRRVRVYGTDCAKFSEPRQRLSYALYWKQEHEALRSAIQEHGAEILGVEDFKAFKRMDEFARHVGDILATVADVIHARRFEDLEAYGFDEA